MPPAAIATILCVAESPRYVVPAYAPLTTRTGVARSVVELSPSWPQLFFPQVYTRPLAASAMHPSGIAEILTIGFVLASPRYHVPGYAPFNTCTGVVRLVVELLPSCDSPLSPHAYTLPSAASA